VNTEEGNIRVPESWSNGDEKGDDYLRHFFSRIVEITEGSYSTKVFWLDKDTMESCTVTGERWSLGSGNNFFLQKLDKTTYRLTARYLSRNELIDLRNVIVRLIPGLRDVNSRINANGITAAELLGRIDSKNH